MQISYNRVFNCIIQNLHLNAVRCNDFFTVLSYISWKYISQNFFPLGCLITGEICMRFGRQREATTIILTKLVQSPRHHCSSWLLWLVCWLISQIDGNSLTSVPIPPARVFPLLSLRPRHVCICAEGHTDLCFATLLEFDALTDFNSRLSFCGSVCPHGLHLPVGSVLSTLHFTLHLNSFFPNCLSFWLVRTLGSLQEERQQHSVDFFMVPVGWLWWLLSDHPLSPSELFPSQLLPLFCKVYLLSCLSYSKWLLVLLLPWANSCW